MSNPEIAGIRALLAASPSGLSYQDLRLVYDGLGSQFPTAEDVTLTADTAGNVAVEWTSTPGAAKDRAILYLHGGGYVIGSILSHRHLAAELGRSAGTQTLAVDYRLAPEHPFPAAVEDALEGYKHLLAKGFKPQNIAIAGDSAGGGLTVATLLAIRDAGLAQPACGYCISPWVDLEGVGGSMTSKAAEDPMVQYEALAAWAGMYAPNDVRAPLVSPIHADLRGIAPLLIQVGSAETLLDDSIRLAGVAGAAEVSVRTEVWPEMIHVWHFFFPVLTDARKALADAGAYIKAAMA